MKLLQITMLVAVLALTGCQSFVQAQLEREAAKRNGSRYTHSGQCTAMANQCRDGHYQEWEDSKGWLRCACTP